MGRHEYDLRAVTTLSRHNSSEDDRDNRAWNIFVKNVKGAAVRSHLDIDVTADDNLPTNQWSDESVEHDMLRRVWELSQRDDMIIRVGGVLQDFVIDALCDERGIPRDDADARDNLIAEDVLWPDGRWS